MLHLQVEKQASEKPSIKSSKAKKTTVRPRSKEKDEDVESNGETPEEKTPKITVTENQGTFYSFFKGVLVNLCHKHLFSHQLTHNMTKDCSLI